jgi:type I site-specific restriction endonuclease
MSQSLSEEEFARLQSQLIELKTSNYNHEEQARRSNAEMSQLRDRVSQLDRELQKANKIISKSKKAKDVSGLVDENEGLQRKIHAMEEEYQLQNRTLMAELSKVCSDNEHLKIQLTTQGVDIAALQEGTSDSSSDKGSCLAELESQVRRLQAENVVFQKTLEGNRERHEQEINDMNCVIESLKASRNQSLLARSPAVVKRFASEHDSGSCDVNEMEDLDVLKDFDCFLVLVTEKGKQWYEENNQEGNCPDLTSFLSLIQSEVRKLKDQVSSSLEKAISALQNYEGGVHAY